MKKVLPILLVILLGGFGLFILFHDSPPNISPKLGCESDVNPVFTHYPTDIDMVEFISPPLMEVSGSLKGHSYINVTDTVPVYAPIDSKLTDGSKYIENVGRRADLDQYLFHFSVSCEVFYFYDHIINPPEKIANSFSGPAGNDSKTKRIKPIEIKAGELIGYSAGHLAQPQHNFDFGVVNRSETTSVAGTGEYLNSPKYNNASCPYKYFEEEKRDILFDLLSYGDAADLVVIDNICN